MDEVAPVDPVDDIWSDDLLGRRRDADFLEAFLVGKVEDRKISGLTGTYVLNLDAEWGAGKSFFLERFGSQLEKHDYIVARINAWRDDHVDDPFVAVLSAIDEALKPYTAKKGALRTAWDGVKTNALPIVTKIGAGMLKTVAKKAVGHEAVEAVTDLIAGPVMGDADEITNSSRKEIQEVFQAGGDEIIVQIESVVDVGAQKLIDSFNEKSKATDTFKYRLGVAMKALTAAKRKVPLFVLVDELDRCRPTYAISLLERIKHLFDADNVVFVFATNSGELQHIVAGAYGPSFDGFGYLKRFFDRTYLLPAPDIGDFVKAECANVNLAKTRTPGQKIDFFVTSFQHYGSGLREIKQAMDLMSSVVSAWRHQIPIEMCILLPLAMSFLRKSSVDKQISSDLIPKVLQIKIGVETDFQTGRQRDKLVSIEDVFKKVNEVDYFIEKAMRIGEGNSRSSSQDYAREIFSPEWNGLQVRPGQKSVQADIIALIAYAGQLSKS